MIVVRRGDDAHIDRMRAGRAERPELALLQHAQQLDLEHRAGIADFVEEDGAAVGLLEATAAILVGAGEGATLVAEEFGLEQLVGQRAAVLDDEGLVGTPAAVVDGARQHLLAGSRFAADQHRQVEGCDALDQRADGVERALRAADQPSRANSRRARSCLLSTRRASTGSAVRSSSDRRWLSCCRRWTLAASAASAAVARAARA
jgi:hypothetical protein